MLVVKHNYRHEYKIIIMALETVLSIGANIVIVQKQFNDNREICHSRLNFYWPLRERKKIQVMTVVRNNFGNRIIIDHRTNLIYYLYFMLLKIYKLDPQSKKLRRKTQVVNIYNNQVERDYI